MVLRIHVVPIQIYKWIVVFICLVRNIKVMTISECWTPCFTVKYCVLFSFYREFVWITQWKYKWLPCLIFGQLSIWAYILWTWCVTANDLVKLCLKNSQSMGNFIALLMKFWCLKTVHSSFIQQLGLCNFFRCKELCQSWNLMIVFYDVGLFERRYIAAIEMLVSLYFVLNLSIQLFHLLIQ